MNSPQRRSHFELALAVLALAALPAAHAQPSYTITDLGLGSAFGINNSGVAVGVNQSGSLTGGIHAVLFSNGTRTDLGDAGQTTTNPSGEGSIARAINDSGFIAGVTSVNLSPDTGSASMSYRGFVSMGLISSGTLFNNVYVEPGGINNSGVVIGNSNRHAFSYSTGDGFRDLGTLSNGINPSSNAYGINNAGTIVGNSQIGDSSSAYHAFTYTTIGGMIDLGLGLPGATDAGATAINDNNQIVGYTNIDLFLYQNGTAIDIGRFGTYGVGDPRAINNSGQIVGEGYSSAWHAYTYYGGTIYDLNDLIPGNSGWVLGGAYDINDSGQIVGYGTFSGDQHAYLLTPIPEPATYATLFGAAALSFVAFRRGLRQRRFHKRCT